MVFQIDQKFAGSMNRLTEEEQELLEAGRLGFQGSAIIVRPQVVDGLLQPRGKGSMASISISSLENFHVTK